MLRDARDEGLPAEIWGRTQGSAGFGGVELPEKQKFYLHDINT